MKVKGWAISYLHLSLNDFGLLHLPEFWSAMDAYWEEKNADRRHLGELVRGATMRLWNLQVDKSHQITEPIKFWTMPWDEEMPTTCEIVKEIDSLSDEERDQMAQDFLKRVNNG